MEHDRWVEERRTKQPGHPDVRPWEELSAEREKEKERHPLGRRDPEIVSSKEAGPEL